MMYSLAAHDEACAAEAGGAAKGAGGAGGAGGAKGADGARALLDVKVAGVSVERVTVDDKEEIVPVAVPIPPLASPARPHP